MKKLILGLCVAIPLFAQYNPEKVTKKDLEELLKLDSKLYEVSKRQTATRKAQMGEIFDFIWINREIKIDPLRERLQLDIVGFTGSRNRRGMNQNADEFDSTLNPYSYVGLQGNLKIIDAKEGRDKKAEILKQRATILKKIETLIAKDLEIENYKEQLEILQHKENLYKIRVAEGVESRATRITNLEAILKTKQNKNKAKIDYEAMKLELLDYVKIEARESLKEILK